MREALILRARRAWERGPFSARLDSKGGSLSARRMRHRERFIQARLTRIDFNGGLAPVKSLGAISGAVLTGCFLLLVGSLGMSASPRLSSLGGRRSADLFSRVWSNALLGDGSLWSLNAVVEWVSIGAGAISLCVGAGLLIARWRWADLEPAGPEQIEPLRRELAWLQASLERDELERGDMAPSSRSTSKRL